MSRYRYRALYAEDEMSNRKVVKLALQRYDVEVDLAVDGQEALTMYEPGKYDIVLLDQYMPFKNGDQVIAEIRKADSKQPVLAITSDDTCAAELLRAGFDDVLIKPLLGTDYLSRIVSHLPK